jgi:hypothetical protein
MALPLLDVSYSNQPQGFGGVPGAIDETDPRRVRIALQNAASVAGLLITAEAMVPKLSDEAPANARRRRVL